MTKKSDELKVQEVNGINDLIQKFQKKHDLIIKREFFVKKKSDLQSIKINSDEIEDFNNFEPIKLKLVKDRNEVVSISNNQIINEVINYVVGLIDNKMKALDTEIISE